MNDLLENYMIPDFPVYFENPIQIRHFLFKKFRGELPLKNFTTTTRGGASGWCLYQETKSHTPVRPGGASITPDRSPRGP